MIKSSSISSTSTQYDKIIALSQDLFLKKMNDYGTAWRILRLPSLTDQILIKAQRIKKIQEVGFSKVEDSIFLEFIGIVNYSLIALIQMKMGVAQYPDIDSETAFELYQKHARMTKNLMKNKNHDYNESWRDMRITSLTDLILQKIFRIKQIENNKGKTMVSEGIESNYQDIINYAVFASIHLSSSL